MNRPPILSSIWTAPRAKQPLVSRQSVHALQGKGLEGDRYAIGRGSLSRWPGSARQVSLIEEEALALLLQETGIDLNEGRNRRNLVTSGISLPLLKGKYFRIGTAVLRGVGLCQPCGHLERLTVPGAFAGLKGRGGLRAEVVLSGTMEVGCQIDLLPDSFKSQVETERLNSVREDTNHGDSKS